MTAAGIRPHAIAGAAIAVGLVVRRYWMPAFQSSLLRALVETFVMIAAVAAASAIVTLPGAATWRRTAYVYSLCTMAWLSFWWAVVPVLEDGVHPRSLGGWSLVLTRVWLAAMFAAAAFLPETRPSRPRLAAAVAGGIVAAGVGGCALAGHFLPMTPDAPHADWGASLNQGAAPFAMRLLTVVLWAAAVIGFAKRAQAHRRLEDRVGTAVAALFTAGTAYGAVTLTLPAAYITPSAGARALAAGLLLAYAVGALRRRNAEVRAIERTRLAALLHQGIAQELALIAMLRGSQLPNGDELADVAARRALTGARETIHRLRTDEEAG